jgi:hypothetical protein
MAVPRRLRAGAGARTDFHHSGTARTRSYGVDAAIMHL